MDDERILCQGSSAWALIDDDPIDEFGWCEDRDWLCIWSASPEKLSSSTWQKEVNAEVLYLDSWTLEEPAAASNAFPRLSSPRMSLKSLAFRPNICYFGSLLVGLSHRWPSLYYVRAGKRGEFIC